ncbi:hypothetical protein UNSWCD_903 [Campylobacter concisus UNSWCD]|nr:hypothetical protein UNSWCD_903 [Campylobacter concisus UNSWCD]
MLSTSFLTHCAYNAINAQNSSKFLKMLLTSKFKLVNK